jgi:hypothetical protein
MIFGDKMKLGIIPAKTSCPYKDKCAFANNNCPTPINLKEKQFDCFVARAWEMISYGSDNYQIRSIISKKIIPPKKLENVK